MSAKGFERCSHLKLVITARLVWSRTSPEDDVVSNFWSTRIGEKGVYMICITYMFFFPWDPYVFICTHMKTQRNQPNLGQYTVRPMDPMLFWSPGGNRGNKVRWTTWTNNNAIWNLGMRLIEIKTPLIPDFSFYDLNQPLLKFIVLFGKNWRKEVWTLH